MKYYLLVLCLCFSSLLQADEGEYSPGRSRSLLKAVQNQQHHNIRKLLQPALLRRPADPNIAIYNNEGEFPLFQVTPLILAAFHSDRVAIDMLLDAGAVPVILDIRSHILFALLTQKDMEQEQIGILKRLYPFLKRKKYQKEWLVGHASQSPGTLLNFALRHKKFAFAQTLLELDADHKVSSLDVGTAVLEGASAAFIETLCSEKDSQDLIDSSVFSWLLRNKFASNEGRANSLGILKILTQGNVELLPKVIESHSSIAVFAAVKSSDETFLWLLQFIEVGVKDGWWPVQTVLKVLKQQNRTLLAQKYLDVLLEKGLKK